MSSCVTGSLSYLMSQSMKAIVADLLSWNAFPYLCQCRSPITVYWDILSLTLIIIHEEFYLHFIIYLLYYYYHVQAVFWMLICVKLDCFVWVRIFCSQTFWYMISVLVSELWTTFLSPLDKRIYCNPRVRQFISRSRFMIFEHVTSSQFELPKLDFFPCFLRVSFWVAFKEVKI